MFGLKWVKKFEWMLLPWVFLSLESEIWIQEEEYYSL